MRTSMKPILSGIALASMLGFAPLSAQANTYDVQECTTAWNDAPAYSYCTGVVFARVQTQTEATNNNAEIGQCLVGSGTCSITVNVGSGDNEVSTTYSPTMGDIFVDVDDVDTIDICFSVSDSAWTAAVKAGCTADETTSGTAASSGLGAAD